MAKSVLTVQFAVHNLLYGPKSNVSFSAKKDQTESNDLEVDIVLPNFDLNEFEKDVNHSGEDDFSKEIDNFIHGQKSKNSQKNQTRLAEI